MQAENLNNAIGGEQKKWRKAHSLISIFRLLRLVLDRSIRRRNMSGFLLIGG